MTVLQLITAQRATVTHFGVPSTPNIFAGNINIWQKRELKE
jgi:hypothetical protein